MQLLFVLALLPLVYLLAWVAAPFLYALHSVVVVAEKIHNQFGPVAQFAYFDLFIVLTVMCGYSRHFFWLGLMPLIVGTCVVAR
jgi:hypothetical protein